MYYGKGVDRIQPPAKVDPERTDQGGFVPRRFHAGFMPCHTFSWLFFGQARFVVGVVSVVPVDIWSKNKLEGICLITVLEKTSCSEPVLPSWSTHARQRGSLCRPVVLYGGSFARDTEEG